jgi:hypothetical protein
MKKLMFLILMIILLSCEKPEEKDKCWTCIEKANNTTVRTWEVCDPVDAASQNGKRWITTIVVSPVPNYVTRVTVHTIDCK